MKAVIFDVEGTLVDCVGQTLECWHETLAEFGFQFTVERLHGFSGMDGQAMLSALLPEDVREKLKQPILNAQGERYRSKFLPTVRPLPGVRTLFENLRGRGLKIALATTCDATELKHYKSILNIDGLIDAVACGEDTPHGKPHPDLFRLALARLSLENTGAIAVGDTPFDAIAARLEGLRAIGALTGGFPARELTAAGCMLVIEEPEELAARLEEIDTAEPVSQSG